MRFYKANDSVVFVSMFMLKSPIIIVGQSKIMYFKMDCNMELKYNVCILGNL
jgi:hypothetical protein